MLYMRRGARQDISIAQE